MQKGLSGSNVNDDTFSYVGSAPVEEYNRGWKHAIFKPGKNSSCFAFSTPNSVESISLINSCWIVGFCTTRSRVFYI